MPDAYAIQARGREAVDLLGKKYADRPGEFGWLTRDLTLLRRCHEDPRFLALAADKIQEMDQCGS
jgi:hypothetical protein